MSKRSASDLDGEQPPLSKQRIDVQPMPSSSSGEEQEQEEKGRLRLLDPSADDDDEEGQTAVGATKEEVEEDELKKTTSKQLSPPLTKQQLDSSDDDDDSDDDYDSDDSTGSEVSNDESRKFRSYIYSLLPGSPTESESESDDDEIICYCTEEPSEPNPPPNVPACPYSSTCAGDDGHDPDSDSTEHVAKVEALSGDFTVKSEPRQLTPRDKKLKPCSLRFTQRPLSALERRRRSRREAGKNIIGAPPLRGCALSSVVPGHDS